MDIFTRKIAITVISALVVHNSQRILESSEKMLRNGLTLLTPMSHFYTTRKRQKTLTLT